MHEGDLILTPPYCWHGHISETDHRTIWFDGANIPLIGALDGSFFEPGSREDNAFWEVDNREEQAWAAAGLVSVDQERIETHSPKFRYPGEATRRTLDATPPRDDGSRMLRYTNPLTGGSVMATLDCFAMRLGADAETRPRRASYNVVCLVVAGQGRSAVGATTFEWSKHDVFTIPHWTWASHQAIDGDADLFLLTDRAVHERLGLVRVETQD